GPGLPGEEPVGARTLEMLPALLNGAEIEALLNGRPGAKLGERLPEPTALVWAYVDEAGRVQRTRLATDTGSGALPAATQQALRQARFSPARNGGRAVAAWVQFPLQVRPESR